MSNVRIPSMTHLLDNTHKRRAIRNLYKMISEGGGGGSSYPPSGGVPKSDLSSSVQASLDLADSAVQPAAIANMEVTSNKVTSISSSSTDTQYPSAKCVYDLVGDIETLLATI